MVWWFHLKQKRCRRTDSSAPSLFEPVSAYRRDATDNLSQTVGIAGYKAYGGDRGGSELATEHRFTGQNGDGTGLAYYRARYYDPTSAPSSARIRLFLMRGMCLTSIGICMCAVGS